MVPGVDQEIEGATIDAIDARLEGVSRFEPQNQRIGAFLTEAEDVKKCGISPTN